MKKSASLPMWVRISIFVFVLTICLVGDIKTIIPLNKCMASQIIWTGVDPITNHPIRPYNIKVDNIGNVYVDFIYSDTFVKPLIKLDSAGNPLPFNFDYDASGLQVGENWSGKSGQPHK